MNAAGEGLSAADRHLLGATLDTASLLCDMHLKGEPTRTGPSFRIFTSTSFRRQLSAASMLLLHLETIGPVPGATETGHETLPALKGTARRLGLLGRPGWLPACQRVGKAIAEIENVSPLEQPMVITIWASATNKDTLLSVMLEPDPSRGSFSMIWMSPAFELSSATSLLVPRPWLLKLAFDGLLNGHIFGKVPLPPQSVARVEVPTAFGIPLSLDVADRQAWAAVLEEAMPLPDSKKQADSNHQSLHFLRNFLQEYRESGTETTT
jgi:hypothetical protein